MKRIPFFKCTQSLHKNFSPLLLLVILFLSGCLGPKKIDKWVANQYGESIQASPKAKNDYLSVTSTLPVSGTVPSNTTKETKKFLPLVFYWQFDYLNTCVLNLQIPINTFTTTVQAYANTKKLKQKLNGQKIELLVNKIPDAFILNDRTQMIWLVYAFSWYNISFRPDSNAMVVSYKILKDNTPVKSGVITVPNMAKAMNLKYLHSVRRTTGEYLDDMDDNIRTMSKKVVDQIITEL